MLRRQIALALPNGFQRAQLRLRHGAFHFKRQEMLNKFVLQHVMSAKSPFQLRHASASALPRLDFDGEAWPRATVAATCGEIGISFASFHQMSSVLAFLLVFDDFTMPWRLDDVDTATALASTSADDCLMARNHADDGRHCWRQQLCVTRIKAAQ